MEYQIIDTFLCEEESKEISVLSPEAQRLYLQAFFKSNFEAFVYLLGYRDTGEFHKEQIKKIAKARFITDNPIRRLWLWSRGFFKTSLITEAHTVWLIVNNPNIRVLIDSFTLEVAKKPLGAIRNHFTSNEEFRFFFKEFCPQPSAEGKIEFGTTENFTVPNRTKAFKEPTVMCAGVGTNLTGLHYDYIKHDDLVTKDSVSNETQIQASKDHYSLVRPLFDNATIPREDVIGTIYHFNDLHSGLIKNAEFEQSFIPVYNDKNEFIFNERINKEGFESICKDPSMNPYDIQSQYLLNPIDPAQRKFRDEWIKYYDDLPDGLSEYVLCDPASAVKKKSDFTVIMRWGVDKNMNIYLLDGIRDKLMANERVAAYVTCAKNAKRLKGAKYEVIGGRHGDLENIGEAFTKHCLHITPQETKSTNASKQDRIEQRLVGQFHAGKVYLPRTMRRVYKHNGKNYDFVEEYLLEFRQFPFSEHDDILDCHSQLFDGEFIQKGIDKIEIKKEDGEFDWWRTQAINAKTTRRVRWAFGSKSKVSLITSKESYR